MTKKILIISTSRADKFLLKPVTEKLGNECEFRNLSSWKPYEIQNMILEGDILSREDKWEKIVLLGDRYETCLLAIHAIDTRKIIFHIHGGEVTAGSKDEFYRHAITKMSHVHITSHGIFSKRIIKMGEPKENVFVTGSLGVWRAKKIDLKRIEERESEDLYWGRINKETLTVILHPNTINPEKTESEITTLLNALKSFSERFRIKFYAPNYDIGRGIIDRKIRAFIEPYGGEYIEEEYGDDFLYSLASSKCIIGNSSCGIIEAPTLRTPTVNVGTRQDGRPMARSIINTPFSTEAIKDCIKILLRKQELGCICFANPYDNTEEDTVDKICDIIQNHPVSFQKRFVD